MPTTITVASWNIEKLGAAKTTGIVPSPGRSEIIAFIARVIVQTGADVVGIMEINSGLGDEVRDQLCATLNNMAPAAGAVWRGNVSSRQDSRPDEEYLWLWREKAGRLVLDPAARPSATSLIGVVDDNLVADLSAAMGWGPAERTQLFIALAANQYINRPRYTQGRKKPQTRTWRVIPAAWQRLSTMAVPEVQFDPALPQQPPAGILGPGGQGARQSLARKLVDADILRFLTAGDRSPFLGNFRVGDQLKPLATAVYHALGPQQKIFNIGPAINTIAMSLPLSAAAAAGNVLVMGDFNVAAREMDAQVEVFCRTDNGQPGFAMVKPVQKQPVFGPILGAPLNARNLMAVPTQPDRRTSMAAVWLDDDVEVDKTLVNPYDKFFFRGAAAPGPQLTLTNEAEVLNLVPFVAAGNTYFDADLARSAMTFYRQFCGASSAQKAVVKLTAAGNTARRQVRLKQYALDSINKTIAANGKRLPPKSALGARQKMVQGDLARAQKALDAATTQTVSARTVLRLVQDATAVAPSGAGTAAAILTGAISDHVPIAVQLTG